MEVHHHAHTAHKKWTHYFWEFFMLFLAITLGFFVENQREHYVEHRRANEYAVNLFNELKVDTARLTHLIAWTNKLINELDTLCEVSRDEKTKVSKLYFYSKAVGSLDFFNTNCATIEQLINSGNLRLMGSDISLGLSKYYRTIHNMENENSLTRVEYEKINDLRLTIFDGYTSSLLTRDLRLNSRDSIFNLDLQLLDDDPKLMRKFIGLIKVETGYYYETIQSFLEPLLDQAKELLTQLKNKYHLQ